MSCYAMFFIEALLFPPIKFRPATKGGDSTTMATLSVFCAVFLVFNLHVSAHLVFEDGYSVTIVFDGNELNVNPRSILPLSGSSDFIILDTSQSTFFTVTFPDWKIKRLTGNGFGFWDADLATAMFNKPKSFAVDVKGNIYVADQANLAIRKISKSGSGGDGGEVLPVAVVATAAVRPVLLLDGDLVLPK